MTEANETVESEARSIQKPPCFSLDLPGDKCVDKLGGYVMNTVEGCGGHRLTAYEWPPSSAEIGSADAVVFLMHGLLTHTAFEWLMPDADNHRVLLRGSLVEKLLSIQGQTIAVVGFDHPAHGRSDGLFGYVDSHDELRDATIDLVSHYTARYSLENRKKIVVAMSMGASTAIRVCLKDSDLIDCYVLLSPAVRPPDDMFGPKGKILKFLSPILNATVPKLQVLSLPPSRDAAIRDACEKDSLLYRHPVRVRMGFEFLRVYDDIHENADKLKFKNVAIFIGLKDHIVSPSGIQEFVDRIHSDNKKVFQFEHLGHDVSREEGCEKAVDQVVQFITDFLAS